MCMFLISQDSELLRIDPACMHVCSSSLTIIHNNYVMCVRYKTSETADGLCHLYKGIS